MSQPADLKSFTRFETITASTTEIDLVIDELDRWTNDLAAASASWVCWGPPPAPVGEQRVAQPA